MCVSVCCVCVCVSVLCVSFSPVTCPDFSTPFIIENCYALIERNGEGEEEGERGNGERGRGERGGEITAERGREEIAVS